jgi:hypothetical protein
MAVTITNDAATTRTNLGLGDAATKTVGTASGNIPVLDSSGDLPTSTYTNTDTVYTHPTTAGNKHIPTSGAADQVLTYSSSGTATWADAAGGGVAGISTGSTSGTALSIDASNRVRLQGNPSFFAYEASGTGANSPIINYSTVDHNVGACFTNSTGRFLAPITGRYLISGDVVVGNVGSCLKYFYLQLYKNGGQLYNSMAELTGCSSNAYSSITLVSIVNVSAGDYFDLRWSKASAGPTPPMSKTNFSAILLG